jgi:uncharacterized protein (TIGR00299 family) protein
MKVAYFDCFAGISGDMILGALIDLGFPHAELQAGLGCLPLDNYTTEAYSEKRMSLKGTRFRVHLGQPDTMRRTFADIITLINESDLDAWVRMKSIEVFRSLAQAEAHLHDKSIADIHFHEVGSTDAIVDIVGSVMGISYLGIDEIIGSALPLGSGTVQCDHGTLPIPAPATVAILRDIPVYGSEVRGELVTPTGAAILATMSESFGSLPPFRIETVGYGVGTTERPELPNMLRVLLGQKENRYFREQVLVIEANIDDMNPELYEHIIESLFRNGALDVLLVPAHMKKNRPGVILKVIALEKDKTNLVGIIFRETTTLGMRCQAVERLRLPRETKTIDTPWGKVKIKVTAGTEGKTEASPEYEDCKEIARRNDIPLKEVYRQVLRLLMS